MTLLCLSLQLEAPIVFLYHSGLGISFPTHIQFLRWFLDLFITPTSLQSQAFTVAGVYCVTLCIRHTEKRDGFCPWKGKTRGCSVTDWEYQGLTIKEFIYYLCKVRCESGTPLGVFQVVVQKSEVCQLCVKQYLHNCQKNMENQALIFILLYFSLFYIPQALVLKQAQQTNNQLFHSHFTG